MPIVLLLGGLVLLYFGGEYLVRGASALALKLQIPPALVGMTVVAIGTSSPELVVSLQAALNDQPDISVGNVVGSNIANVGLILGLTILIFPFAVRRDILRFDWVAMMVASILFYVLSLNLSIGRLEGAVFLAALILYITFSFMRARYRRNKKIDVPAEPKKDGEGRLVVLLLFIVLGTVALIFGARWFLSGATDIARNFGVSDRIIAVTLVAFGTSIPELAASVIAAFKKEEDISLGNIVGSNLFNLLAILGITALVSPVSISPDIINSDVFWMLGTSFAILPLAVIGRRFGRLDGILLIASYIAFIYFVAFKH